MNISRWFARLRLIFGILVPVLPLTAADAKALRGVLIQPAQAAPKDLQKFASEGFESVAICLEEAAPIEERRKAAEATKAAGLKLHFWIEVARNTRLADSNPEWMASIQTHPEWRRFFPGFPREKEGEVVKVYPWVPVLYKESFEAHLDRVARLMDGLPEPDAIFLNDLQGAPSACGCGNRFCRWTTDYGPIRTATRLPDDAAARFVAAVQKLRPKAKVVPVWTTECAEVDGAKGAACDGVSCFRGRCWKEYSNQLMPVAEVAERIGVLLPFRDFDDGISQTGPSSVWQKDALKSFAEIVPKRGGRALPPGRLLPVLQGWDVSSDQIREQLRHAAEAGTADYLVALTKIEQGWSPRLMDVKSRKLLPVEAAEQR